MSKKNNKAVRYSPETTKSKWYNKKQIVKRNNRDVSVNVDGLEFRGNILAENESEIEVEFY